MYRFLIKKRKIDDVNKEDETTERQQRTSTPSTSSPSATPARQSDDASASSSYYEREAVPPPSQAQKNDFGLYLGKVSDERAYAMLTDRRLGKKLLEDPWTPDSNFNFPKSGPRNLRFQHKWINEHKWLVYSAEHDGAYCKYCFLFATTVGHQRSQPQKFVKTPFRDWKDAKAELKKPSEAKYHMLNAERAADFLATYAGEKISIEKSIDRGLQIQIQKNRDNLKPIIESAIFLAKLGIPFRGHRDSGPFDVHEPIKKGEGNFRSLLKFRLQSGDEIFKEHLKNAASNATYISWQTQNEIIEAIDEIIVQRIVDRVNSADFFSIMCDESIDIAATVQLSFCVRFVDKNRVYEDFVKFVPVKDCTGAGFAKSICDALDDLKLEGNKLVGQGYDGAGAMSGYLKGAQAIIKQTYEKATYVHCVSHSFNLSLTDGCNLREIRNCMGILNSTWEFFRDPKRQNVLQEEISKPDLESESTSHAKSHKEKLKRACPTRWIERHIAVSTFIELLDTVVNSLETVSEWNDKKASSDAQQLANSICRCDFVVPLFIIDAVFEITLPLSRYLQSENIDLKLAYDFAMLLKESLTEMRSSVDVNFSKIFRKIEGVCNKHDVQVTRPRVVARQIHKANYPSETPEEYYRRSVYIPFLDQTISAIDSKFVQHRSVLQPFRHVLIPPNIPPEDEEVSLVEVDAAAAIELTNLANIYKLPTNSKGEMLQWKRSLRKRPELPVGALEALQFCDAKMYPTVRSLLTIMATLPVTSCTCERSFSILKHLKTYLRSTTGEQRLSGLASAFIHSETHITADTVLDILARKPRRVAIRLQ